MAKIMYLFNSEVILEQNPFYSTTLFIKIVMRENREFREFNCHLALNDSAGRLCRSVLPAGFEQSRWPTSNGLWFLETS